MKKISHQNFGQNFLLGSLQRHSGTTGNVLIYIVVLMLIFGTLGVAMVSLFSSSMASTATSNDTRRARYLSEAGVRYAIGQMRNEDFDENYITDPLNTLTYTVDGAGTFEPNVFGPWFDSDASVDSPDVIGISPRLGEIPSDFTAPALTGVWLVNYAYITGVDPDSWTVRNEVISYTKNGTSLDVDITSDFVTNIGERVCLAVVPKTDQTINEGQDLYVARDARLFFPPFNGAVNIHRIDYAYERLVDDEDNDQVILENVTASQFPSPPPSLPDPFPLTVDFDPGSPYTGDYVILSPQNYMTMAEGTADEVIWGDAYALGMNVYDPEIRPGSRKADITAEDFVTNLSEQESYNSFFVPNLTDYELDIGGNQTDQFGSAFYNATRNIGGERNYCQQGACLLALGVRVFFLLDFDSQGEGITFTLLGQGLDPPLNNSATSAGGDKDLSELMGYAGDSRRFSPADPTNTFFWVATNPDDRGLDPPKIAAEFDTQTNEPTFNLCSGSDANSDTRNDPVPPPEANDGQDVVQYVFWGREDLSLSCRAATANQMATFDDNRHNADDWAALTGDDVRSSPAVADDGTIYVGSDDGHLYAFDPEGTELWQFPSSGSIGAVKSSPAVGADGTIYVGSDDFNVYAINPNGTQKWRFSTLGQVRSSPAVVDETDGTTTIYIGSNDGNMYALVDDGTTTVAQRPGWPFDASADLDPPLSLSESFSFSFGRPAIRNDGVIVFSALNNLFARNPDGSFKYKKTLGVRPGGNNTYMPGVNPNTGTVYSDIAGDKIVAYNSDGTFKWDFFMGADVDSTPIVGRDGRIYFGTDITDDGKYPLFAVDPDARSGSNSSTFPVTAAGEWRFLTQNDVDNIPALNSDGSEVYVVSMDGNLYTVNTTDGSEISRFPIPVTPTSDASALPNSSPAVGPDGTVYVGSTDNNLYAVGRIVEPSNIKNKYITSTKDGTKNRVAGQEVDVGSRINWLNGDSSDQKRWAVRLEVDRIGSDYSLSLWIRQCDNSICDNVLGTFFQDTRVDYEYSAVPDDLPLQQTFTLNDPLNDPGFERFFFGFTGAAGAEALDATISEFQLSFIRPGDTVIVNDSINWPAE